MTVEAEFRDFVLDLLRPLRPTARRMFGGFGIMRDGVMFALLSNDTMYFRVHERTRPKFEAEGCAPFAYRRAGREVTMASYYAVPDRLFDEHDAMLDWAREAIAAAQSAPRRGTRRSAARPRG